MSNMSRIEIIVNDIKTIKILLDNIHIQSQNQDPNHEKDVDFTSVATMISKGCLSNGGNLEDDHPSLFMDNFVLLLDYVKSTGVLDDKGHLTPKAYELLAILSADDRIVELLKEHQIPTTIDNIFLANTAKIQSLFK